MRRASPAASQGNEARFINHSCKPSCEAFVVPSESGARVIICSKQGIQPCQELTLDYHQAAIQVRAAGRGAGHAQHR